MDSLYLFNFFLNKSEIFNSEYFYELLNDFSFQITTLYRYLIKLFRNWEIKKKTTTKKNVSNRLKNLSYESASIESDVRKNKRDLKYI